MNFQLATKLAFILMLFSLQISKAETITGSFEILDLSGDVSGEPQLASEAARNSWQRACLEWKKETKELNKKNEMIAINCGSPSCTTIDFAKTQCTSNGTYKIKTAGTRAAPIAEPSVISTTELAPVSDLPPLQEEQVSASPTIVVEAAPPPRYGYVWIPGVWSWRFHHHVWAPGHWTRERWYHEHWAHEHWNRWHRW